VYRIIYDRDVAEEVCHDAFARFFRISPEIPDATQAKYWLLRVAKNLALNVAKRRVRERNAYQRVFNEPQRVENPEAPLLREETMELVQEALASLPPKLKEVLVLKEYGELNYVEIGKVLGISVANVKVRVHRARERLAKLLEAKNVYRPQ
jgi:RNA polymerase sigma-70 factor (ECF subfamily)